LDGLLFLVILVGCEARSVKEMPPDASAKCEDFFEVPAQNCSDWKDGCDLLYAGAQLENNGVDSGFAADLQQFFLPWCENVTTATECYGEIACGLFYGVTQYDPQEGGYHEGYDYGDLFAVGTPVYQYEYYDSTDEPMAPVEHIEADGTMWSIMKKVMAKKQQKKLLNAKETEEEESSSSSSSSSSFSYPSSSSSSTNYESMDAETLQLIHDQLMAMKPVWHTEADGTVVGVLKEMKQQKKQQMAMKSAQKTKKKAQQMKAKMLLKKLLNI